ncbi:pyruvate, phosphate dikinase [Neomegalonema sp.]|uniref:pyruvate, phosphate dikinase n=1 Tax=Neomegalonema sp. TaxID=2039713 RepID=UPI00260C9001|nr:pyruvate, phosphate dikinase [Neomegalonema sp.]MDD2867642.1 pyruvate, phosphate dikinase [Neomegalonema sp.]
MTINPPPLSRAPLWRPVARFGAGLSEGSAADAPSLGGKGSQLCELARLGLPTKPGFVISLEAGREARGEIGPDLWAEIEAALGWLEEAAGLSFSDPGRPLLVSVRSSPPVSMPGMMDTLLNVGLTREATAGLAMRAGGNLGFALDCRRRLLPALAEIAFDIEPDLFEEALDELKEERDLREDSDLSAADWAEALERFERILEEEEAASLPDSPREQLALAIKAVWASAEGARARAWRSLNKLPQDMGSAVVVQAMAFGNLGPDSATGVVFTRDPSTGAPGLFGEYLPQAQGEEVVSGLRTPRPLSRAAREALGGRALSLEETVPGAYADLTEACRRLEAARLDVQDVEFTVEAGRLFLLQTRPAQRTPRAALRIAADLASEGLISRDDALMRVAPALLERLLHPGVDPAARRETAARGLAASPGAAVGEAVFSAAEAEALARSGRPSILIRAETSPEDIRGIYAADGVLTARGGMTSHAAVIARGLGKPCVCGAGELRIFEGEGLARLPGGRIIRRGDPLTLDGTAGEALFGAMPLIPPPQEEAFERLMGWADARRRLGVRANVDAPAEAEQALKFGAEGIGLCRSEQALFSTGRLTPLRETILASDPHERRAALEKLGAAQRADLEALFRPMAGRPVALRLMDPPLHEFLPRTPEEMAETAASLGVSAEAVAARAADLAEFNPMLGRRGCRIGVLYPEIYEAQARAAFEAALDLGPLAPKPLEIILPFLSTRSEMSLLRRQIEETARRVLTERDAPAGALDWRLGAMIETPRAALRAEDLAEDCDFFTFGTNDLTQMTFGLSRDDAGRFMRDYIAAGALSADPFHVFDEVGVGELMRLAVERGRSRKPGLLLGVCGEHGADPEAVAHFHEMGVDYVSCSPYRAPLARLAAAQAAIRAERAAVKPPPAQV